MEPKHSKTKPMLQKFIEDWFGAKLTKSQKDLVGVLAQGKKALISHPYSDIHRRTGRTYKMLCSILSALSNIKTGKFLVVCNDPEYSQYLTGELACILRDNKISVEQTSSKSILVDGKVAVEFKSYGRRRRNSDVKGESYFDKIYYDHTVYDKVYAQGIAWLDEIAEFDIEAVRSVNARIAN